MTPAQRVVLDWYADEGRCLPWRNVDDAYAVLVSEFMLQQTQVSRVVPLFEAFLTKWPTPASLAAASRADVLRAWQGLGYNRRAVALHRAAQAVVEHHDGAVPGDLDALLSLPGVGPYTARAVLAFAFGRDVAPVDTNIRRVILRSVVGAPLTGRALQMAADDAVPAGRGRDWSAALMDLGSRYCTSRPACTSCPIAVRCAWAQAGGADPAESAPRSRSAMPFVGSNRYHRGRLLDALRNGAVARPAIAAAAMLGDADAAQTLAAGLVRDGLAEWDADDLRLPA